jgi:TPR repeat protein
MELYIRAAELGYSKAYYRLGDGYFGGGGFEEGQVPL